MCTGKWALEMCNGKCPDEFTLQTATEGALELFIRAGMKGFDISRLCTVKQSAC